ncbi:MAG: cytochrome d ubiquinol oxidase subunit II [Candidatus Dormibacteraceae bacterium]
MNQATVIVAILWLSLTAYAVLAGADFGGGVWDMLAGGPRAEEQRRAVENAIGPVWEANHVWLIFLVVGLFTAFPIAFATLSVTLYLPFTVALVGIVLRGAGFAFHTHLDSARQSMSSWRIVFRFASLLTPAMLGVAAAAVASGRLQVSSSGGFTIAWISFFGLDMALLAVALCAYLAATYLMVETAADPPLQADFRRRAMLAGVVSGGLALIGLGLAWFDARWLFKGLFGAALPLLILALINGPLALWAVIRAEPSIARLAVAGEVVLVLWTWGVAQWPYLVPPDLTIQGSASSANTLDLFLVTVVLGMALLLPSLYLLFRIFKRDAVP